MFWACLSLFVLHISPYCTAVPQGSAFRYSPAIVSPYHQAYPFAGPGPVFPPSITSATRFGHLQPRLPPQPVVATASAAATGYNPLNRFLYTIPQTSAVAKTASSPSSSLLPSSSPSSSSPTSSLPLLRNINIGVSSIPYIDARALCTVCDCEQDFGCGYNCQKCDALCLTCDCNTSLGCKYNCDKCEESSGAGSAASSSSSGSSSSSSSSTSSETLSLQISNDIFNPGSSNSLLESSSGQSTSGSSSSFPASVDSSSGSSSSISNPTRDPTDCSALLSPEIELCMWGPSCKHMVTSLFPSCNYSCSTCQLNPSKSCVASGGQASGQQCVFPFIYKGVKYNGCAPLHSETSGVEFWCSTKTDVNGYHITGPYREPGKYVGMCDSSCPKDLPTFFK